MLSFICDPCKTAANLVSKPSDMLLTVKRHWHDMCKGNTWCDCQCRVGRKNNNARA